MFPKSTTTSSGTIFHLTIQMSKCSNIYDCEENEQKTLIKNATDQVTQWESEPQSIEITNIMATLYSKARATTLKGN